MRARLMGLVLVAGCGVSGSDDGGPEPAIARLVGTLEGARMIDTKELRVSLAWIGDGLDATKRPWVFQDVQILRMTQTWPAEFELGINDPPPAGALHFDIGYSQARLVAYLDGNGNDQLDLTPVDADHFIDRIVAFHPHLVLWYFDNEGLKLMLPGQTEQVEPTTPITMLERSDLRSSCHALEWMPRSAHTAAMHSYPDPDEGDQGPWDHEGFLRAPNNEPPAGTTRLTCDQTPGPGDYYFMSSSTTTTSAFVAETCGPVMRVFEGRRASPQDGAPWPCPCDSSLYACGHYWSDL